MVEQFTNNTGSCKKISIYYNKPNCRLKPLFSPIKSLYRREEKDPPYRMVENGSSCSYSVGNSWVRSLLQRIKIRRLILVLQALVIQKQLHLSNDNKQNQQEQQPQRELPRRCNHRNSLMQQGNDTGVKNATVRDESKKKDNKSYWIRS